MNPGALPEADRPLTKSDVREFEASFAAELRAFEAGFYRRMLFFYVTLLLGLAGMTLALLLKG